MDRAVTQAAVAAARCDGILLALPGFANGLKEPHGLIQAMQEALGGINGLDDLAELILRHARQFSLHAWPRHEASQHHDKAC